MNQKHVPLHGFGIRLAAPHRWLVCFVLSLVALSGLLLTVLHDILLWTPGSLERWTLIVHGGVSFCVLILFGSLLPAHVRLGWKTRRHLVSGCGALSILTTLILTAFFLYYGGESSRELMKWSHVAIGVLGMALLPGHIYMGNQSRRNQKNAPFK